MNLIVAVDENWGIGYNGTQPLVIPEDRKHFRELTAGKIVVVGRKTLEDFPNGKPLAKRENIVVTKNNGLQIDGAVMANDVSEIFEIVSKKHKRDVFIIGGASIYKMLTDYCEYAYVTKIYATPPADTYFENLDENEDWEICDRSEKKIYEGVAYEFITYKNKNVRSR